MLRSEAGCQIVIDEFLEVDISTQDKDRLELNKRIDSVSMDPQTITYHGKQVTQITLIGYFMNTGPLGTNTDNLAATRVILQLNDGSHVLLRFKNPTLENQQMMYSLLKFSNGICQHAFHDLGNTAYDKEYWINRALAYTPKERAYYDRTHKSMAKSLLENIQKNSDYSAKAKKGVCIISLCCGDGKDMQTCYDTLCDAGFKNCIAIGIDSSQNVIDANKKTKTPHRFIQANIENIEETLKLLITTRALNVDGKLVIFISSGALSRRVIDGTRAALEVIQQLLIGDILIAGSYTPLLIAKEAVEASGLDIKVQNYCAHSDDEKEEASYSQLFICQRQSATREFAVTLERSKIRGKDPKVLSTLDLSFTAKPLQQCAVFLDQELASDVVQIDLSWSRISKDAIPELLTLFCKFPKLKFVTISGYELWSRNLINELIENPSSFSFTLLKRLDSTNPEELPTISVHLCKQLGIYSTFPNKIIVKGTANPKKQAELKDTDTVMAEEPVDKKFQLESFSVAKLITTGRKWATPKKQVSKGPYANHDVTYLNFEKGEERAAKEVEKQLIAANYSARILTTKSGKPSVTVDLTASHPEVARLVK